MKREDGFNLIHPVVTEGMKGTRDGGKEGWKEKSR